MLLNTIQRPDTASAEEQMAYAARVARLLGQRLDHQPLAMVHTFGCQQNVSDGERLKGFLAAMGYAFTEEAAKADLILLNTCAVRAHAEDRVFGNIGRYKALKKTNPDLIIAVCGCMVQQAHIKEKLRVSYPYVDLTFGPPARHRLPELLYRRLTDGRRIFENGEGFSGIVEGTPVLRDGTYKAWLPIMSGCDNFCTYCIVPYVRGREVSRPPEAVLKEAGQLIASGVREITLLGQNVNSYGKKENFGVDFAKLLRMLNDLPGDFRIRFMTSHPKDCTEALLYAMRDCEKVCRHLHLPVQSGNDRVLQKMNRRYNRAHYLALVQKARELMPDITLTSDIIVGFPGETYEEFCDTLRLIREVEYYSLFTFIYSPRVGTPAAEMEDPVSHAEKGAWFRQLLAAQEEIAKTQNAVFEGKTLKVLCEEYDAETGTVTGHTHTFATVSFPGGRELLGRFVSVLVTDGAKNMLGKMIKIKE